MDDTTKPSLQALFGLDTNHKIAVLHDASEYIPVIDHDYYFDPDTTQAIVTGFTHRKHVMIQGAHGTGKSTHIEQVAARLNWPLIRLNLDGHIHRMDLIGKEALIIEEGNQVTRFKAGIIPFALQEGIALLFDEFDAAPPEVMFILQRLLENEGQFTLLEENKIITPHPNFRIFATCNTHFSGDVTGLYHGTQAINKGLLDRFSIVTTLNYMEEVFETQIIKSKVPKASKSLIKKALQLASLTRNAFQMGELSNVMSPRTVIAFCENVQLFGTSKRAFMLSFVHKCDPSDQQTLAEMYQRCFNEELF